MPFHAVFSVSPVEFEVVGGNDCTIDPPDEPELDGGAPAYSLGCCDWNLPDGGACHVEY